VLNCYGLSHVTQPDKGAWNDGSPVNELRRSMTSSEATMTGTATFYVPLYTLSVEGLNLNFGLRYYSNGIRRDDNPYPVGYGWSIEPPIKVSRQIQGRPDGLFSPTHWNVDGRYTHRDCFNCMNDSNIHGQYAYHGQAWTDSEPDIFTFHMPDRTFNAVWYQNRFVGVGCDEYTITASNELNQIYVTDSQGLRYVFAQHGKYLGLQSNVTEWMLSCITLPSSRTIYFEWLTSGFDYMGKTSLPSTVKYEFHENGSGVKVVKNDYDGISMYSSGRASIGKVKFPGGDLTFTYGSAVSSQYKVLREVSLEYSEGKLELARVRQDSTGMRLDLLYVRGQGLYTFEYGNYPQTDGIDWWGFYNGTQAFAGDSPSALLKLERGDARTEEYSFSGANRRIDVVAMQSHILKKAVLPTGGSIEWNYEVHSYPTYSHTDAAIERHLGYNILHSAGGGLRVSDIIVKRNDEDMSPAKYHYVYNGGVCTNAPTLDTFISEKEWLGYGNIGTSKSGLFRERTLTMRGYSDYMSYRLGEVAVWYQEVTEIAPEGCTKWTFQDICPPNDIVYDWGGAIPRVIRKAFSKKPRLMKKSIWSDGKISGPVYTVTFEYDMIRNYPSIHGVNIRRRLHHAANGRENSPDFSSGLIHVFNQSVAVPGYHLTSIPQKTYTFAEDEVYEVSAYTIELMTERLKSHTSTEHTETGDITTLEKYTYKPGTELMASVTVVRGDSIRTVLHFPSETSSGDELVLHRNRASGVITGSTQYYNGKEIYSTHDNYAVSGCWVYPRSTTTTCAGSSWVSPLRTYDVNGCVTSSTDSAGICTYMTWDSHGRNQLSQSVGGLETTWKWEPFVGVKESTDPAGILTHYRYSKDGNLISERVEGLGYIRRHEYHVSQDGEHWSSTTICADKYGDHHPSEWQYYDAFGRPTIHISRTGSNDDIPGHHDISDGAWLGGENYGNRLCGRLMQYDDMGRISREWSSVPVMSSVVSDSTIIAEAVRLYSDSFAYTEIEYERSPRAYAVAGRKAGSAWQEAGKKTRYRRMANGYTGPACRRYRATNHAFAAADYYPSGSLVVEEIVDEDMHTVRTFTDIRGLKIREMRGGSGNWAIVDYVYDDYGRLRYILPPGLSDATTGQVRTSTQMQQLAYWFDYDARGRLIARRVPGVPASEYRYDGADRLVAENTPDLGDRWRLYLYDECGRNALCLETASHPDNIAGLSTAFTTRLADGCESTGGYIVPWQLSDIKVVYANYYDTHLFIRKLNLSDDFNFKANAGGADFTLAERSSSDLGRLTGMCTGNSHEVYYYDAYGRMIQQYGTGFAAGRVSRTHTHQGLVKQERTDFPSYIGNLPRMLTTNQYCECQLTGQDIWLADSAHARVRYTYDYANRLSSRVLGTFSTPPRQRIEYDVHGWVSAVHHDMPVYVVKPYKAPGFDDIIVTRRFDTTTRKYKYNDGKYPRYSGLITQMTWDGNTYDYEYDRIGRLTGAEYSHATSSADFSTAYTYDIRGNITGLTRNGVVDRTADGIESYGVIDDATATYDGNRRVSVTNTAGDDVAIFSGRSGFGRTFNGSLSYDDAGRLIADETRNIQSIDYNTSGLPVKMLFLPESPFGRVYMQKQLEWAYDGLGRHLSSTYISDVSPTAVFALIGYEHRQYFASGLICRTNKPLITQYTLDRILFPGGYFDSEMKPHYYLTDHQGNNVAVVDDNGNMVQQTDYYPYGEPWRRPTSATSIGARANPYLFSGKEYDNTMGMSEYDFEARRYTALLPGFTTIDPAAESTPWLSPYTYCAGNPISLTDPTGRKFTEDAEKIVGKLEKGLLKVFSDNFDAFIRRLLSDLFHMNIYDEALHGQNYANFGEACTALFTEIPALRCSEMTYHITYVSRPRLTMLVDVIESEDLGGTQYDLTKDNILITLQNHQLSMLAHELKHAYQFETGDLDYKIRFYKAEKRDVALRGDFYDQVDEIEAYRRGKLFGGDDFNPKSDKYASRPKCKISWSNMNPSSSESLQKDSDNQRRIFMYKGIIYKPSKKK